MTDWKWFKSSKYPASCHYCKKTIDLAEGRWSSKDESGARYNACSTCIKPPIAPTGPPPLPGTVPTVQPTIDGGALPRGESAVHPAPAVVQAPAQPRESREDAIERMHAENVLWAKSQYDALEKIAERLNAMHATMIARNRLLVEKMEKEAKA